MASSRPTNRLGPGDVAYLGVDYGAGDDTTLTVMRDANGDYWTEADIVYGPPACLDLELVAGVWQLPPHK